MVTLIRLTFISRFHQIVNIFSNKLSWSILSYIDKMFESIMDWIRYFPIWLETPLHNFVDFELELEQLKNHGRVLFRIHYDCTALLRICFKFKFDPFYQII